MLFVQLSFVKMGHLIIVKAVIFLIIFFLFVSDIGIYLHFITNEWYIIIRVVGRPENPEGQVVMWSA